MHGASTDSIRNKAYKFNFDDSGPSERFQIPQWDPSRPSSHPNSKWDGKWAEVWSSLSTRTLCPRQRRISGSCAQASTRVQRLVGNHFITRLRLICITFLPAIGCRLFRGLRPAIGSYGKLYMRAAIGKQTGGPDSVQKRSCNDLFRKLAKSFISGFEMLRL